MSAATVAAVVAIDCSHVPNAAEATSLVADARHRGARFIELHNVAVIDARGEGAALDALAADPTVKVMRRGPAPRGRLYQHEALHTRELEGAVVERAVAWRSSRDDRAICGLLWLKPRGGAWQRFFLDVGFGVWEEESDEDTARELADLAAELEDLPALAGEHLGAITLAAAGAGDTPELRITTASGLVLCLYPRDPRDPDSDTLLSLGSLS